MARVQHYRRVVVMVREGHALPPPFRLAAELAHLLELELEGVFVEDEALVALSAFPFARELRLPGHTWQVLDPARMLEDLQMAAGEARRLLAEAAARLGVASTFSVLRGDPHSAPAEQAGAEDILVLVEPGGGGVAAIRTLGAEFFRGTRSGVLLVPARPAAPRGSVALLLPTEAAAVIEVAAALACASGEDVVLIVPENEVSSEAEIAGALRREGVPAERLRRRRVPGRDAGSIIGALRAAGARIVVLDRAGYGADLQDFLGRLLGEAGTAVLLLGEVRPPRTAP